MEVFSTLKAVRELDKCFQNGTTEASSLDSILTDCMIWLPPQWSFSTNVPLKEKGLFTPSLLSFPNKHTRNYTRMLRVDVF